MKRMIPFFVLALGFAALTAYAADQMIPEALTLKSPDHGLLDSYRVVVTSDDKLMTKPGPIFTEGVNDENVQLPYLVSTPEAIRYPRWAIRQGWEGEFIVAIEVLKNGEVGRYKVMQSSGHEVLDHTALNAVRSWKFHPAIEQGQAVVTCVQIPVRFQLLKN